MQSETVKIVVFVPETHADAVRQALGDAGAGVIGEYHHCSFSIKGQGRFIPSDKAQPYIGEVAQPGVVDEERIETPCLRADLPKIIKAVKAVHPYEESVIEVYEMVEL